MDSTQGKPKDFRAPERWNSVLVPERVAERAIQNVDMQENGCWISRYSVASHGYAQIGWSVSGDRRVDGKKTHMVLAHRAAWVYVFGQIPLGMTIDHTCKTRRCVNPEHLRLLPNFENAQRVNGMDWPIGYCANGHSNELRISREVRGHRGQRRVGSICEPCKLTYAQRGTWRARHPGEPMPKSLLLKSEVDG